MNNKKKKKIQNLSFKQNQCNDHDLNYLTFEATSLRREKYKFKVSNCSTAHPPNPPSTIQQQPTEDKLGSDQGRGGYAVAQILISIHRHQLLRINSKSSTSCKLLHLSHGKRALSSTNRRNMYIFLLTSQFIFYKKVQCFATAYDV